MRKRSHLVIQDELEDAEADAETERLLEDINQRHRAERARASCSAGPSQFFR